MGGLEGKLQWAVEAETGHAGRASTNAIRKGGRNGAQLEPRVGLEEGF